MIKMSELQPGDVVMADFEGQQREGIVKELNREDKEVCVESEVQEFWYKPEDLYPILLSEEQLFKLGFTKHPNEDGTVKYMKDSFRLKIFREGDFKEMEIWWREDHRHLHQHLMVHELQNHYYQMTKVELNLA